MEETRGDNMTDTNNEDSGRKLIAMLSLNATEGKTDDELAEELAEKAWQAWLAHRQAEEQGGEFEPVLDVRPEPE
jgi:hypothetical protein